MAPRYRVQVVTVGTHEPTYKWHTIPAESAPLACREAVTLNQGLGGLGRVEVVSVEEVK